MPDFNVRADSVNVEQIMEQIRARIRDKRGVDYTEEQIRELAAVKLEKFLDPRSIRSDLLDQFRKAQPPAAPVSVPLYPFEDTTLFDSHRGIVRFFRRLFRPLVKLFFNSNALTQSLHQQTIINRQSVDRLDAVETSVRQRGDLYYELLHNLVLELTRATIEVKNMSMRVESIASRLEFTERRLRALESVVVYKPAEPEREARAASPAPVPSPQRASGGFAPRENQRNAQQAPTPRPPSPAPVPPASAVPAAATPTAADGPSSGDAPAGVPAEGPGQRSRRRRRRRGRRGGASAVSLMTTPGPGAGSPAPGTAASADQTHASASDAADSDEPDEGDDAAEPFEQALSPEPTERRGEMPQSTPTPTLTPTVTPPPTVTPTPTQAETPAAEPRPASDTHHDNDQ
ncbi:MAG TPA: hypothetical protein VHU82_03255 [Vicinamibacterales bacterium]|nr:hypothetical protein [Vicinamibacterales bacterium]